MISTIRSLFIFGLIISTSYVKSQNDTLELSLNQAMAYATEFGYQSINATHDIEIAKKKVRETFAIGLPQISGSGLLTKNLLISEIMVEFNGETQSFKMGTNYNSTIGAQANQLLFDGSYLVGLQATKVYVQLSENAKEKTDIELKQAVAQAYFITLVAHRNMADFETSLKNNEETLLQTKAYFNAGFKEDIDVDQVHLMVNESKRQYLDAKNQLAIAMAVLKFTIGLGIDKPLKTSDSIDDLIALIPVNSIDNTDLLSHIDYKTVNSQIDIQTLNIKNQKAQALPTLNAYASYDYTLMGDNLSDLSNTDAAAIGLTLSVPIFSSGQRSAQLKQKKLEMTKLSVEKKMLEESLKKDLMIAKANLFNTKEQYNNAVDTKEITNRIYNKSLLKFKNGLMSSLELSQHENSLVEAIISLHAASTNYFNTYINYQKASAQL